MIAEFLLKPDVGVRRVPDQQANVSLMPDDVMPADVVEQSEEVRGWTVSRTVSDDLALLHSLLGHYARQLLDIQKVRVAMGNRLDAMERDGVPLEHRTVATAQAGALEAAEHALNLHLTRLARKHPLRAWVEQAPGIGLAGFARLMGITGPLDRFSNVAKLWAYLGLHVVDGAAPKRCKGEAANWSPAGRVLCHQLAEAIVKLGRGKYRAAYDRKKACYEEHRLDWTQAHRHEAAMRYAVKELLKDMWLEWRCRVPSDAQGSPAHPLQPRDTGCRNAER